MATKGQTINDRLNAAKYALAGQGLARCVCKATTEEPIGPKRKHLNYLLECTYETNVSIPQIANLLIERTNNSSWVVVYKALITVHHLMSFGSERFTQYLSSSNYSFQLNGFLDRSVNRGYTMSPFVRRYSNYINAKALSYRKLAFDSTRIKPGPDNIMRTMSIERLTKTLPVIQSQMDVLLEFDCTSDELSNGVIVASFMMMFRDLVKLFASYNDGIINLLGKYFSLNKNLCRPAFEIYQKFTVRLDHVSAFLRVAESVGINRGEIPDLKKAPTSLLDALESHLHFVESKRKEPTRSPSLRTTVSLGKSALMANDERGDWAVDNAWSTNLENSEAVREALEEEARAIQKFEKRCSLASSVGSDWPGETAPGIDALDTLKTQSKTNPFNPFVTDIPRSESPVNNLDTVPKVEPAKSSSAFDTECDDFDPRAEEIAPKTLSKEPEQQKIEKDPFGFVTGSQSAYNFKDNDPTLDSFETKSLWSEPEINFSPSPLPPGYAPGTTLLKPEQISRPRVDPSIDAQTLHQLEQIRQEQASYKLQQKPTNPSTIASSTRVNHPRSEMIRSAFEDLELVMRRSMSAQPEQP